MTTRDKQMIAQVLKETIIQLCKANSLYSGQVEVDGIICISGQVEGQELVIKVHETFGTQADHLRGIGYVTKDRYQGHDVYSSPAGAYNFFHQERKRRRIENEYERNGASMAAAVAAAPFGYFSKFAYGAPPDHHLNMVSSVPEVDYLNTVKDLSMKALGAVAANSSQGSVKELLESRDERSPTPLRDASPETGLDLQNMLYKSSSSSFAHPSFHPKRLQMTTNERWSPNKPLPTVPQCKICTVKFETSEILSEHNEQLHSVFTCLCCFKTFTSRSNLERHSRLHTGHKPYSCAICGKAFSRKASIVSFELNIKIADYPYSSVSCLLLM